MNRTLDSSLRFMALTGIVATMLCGPAGGLLAVFARLLFGLPFHAFLTFGERLPAPLGLVAWWALAWPPAAVYVGMFLRA